MLRPLRCCECSVKTMLQWIRIGRPWFKASANSLFCRRAEKRAIVFRHGSEMCRSQSTHTSTWRSSTIQIKSYGWPPKARQWLCTQRCQHATRQRNSWSSLLLAFGHLNSFDISVRSFESFGISDSEGAAISWIFMAPHAQSPTARVIGHRAPKAPQSMAQGLF
jgi:hypothetical protein